MNKKALTTRDRIKLLAQELPFHYTKEDLVDVLLSELGHVDILDKWIKKPRPDQPRAGYYRRARAPHLIYHICAGNLPISAITSLILGILLGSRNIVKLPSDRDDEHTRVEILKFIQKLPKPLRPYVTVHDSVDSKILSEAEVIIAFGSDATMESLRAQIRWNQKFIAHGHAVSLLWLEEPEKFTFNQAHPDVMLDICLHDQLGCLSPQAIYMPDKKSVISVGEILVQALETGSGFTNKTRTLGQAARIQEARDIAYALGHQVWLPSNRHLGWTIIYDPDPLFKPSPLYRVIYLRVAQPRDLKRALAPVIGSISTVGIIGKKLSAPAESAFLELGVTRFCPAGIMQGPSLSWHHDGRMPLADLVTWIDQEKRGA